MKVFDFELTCNIPDTATYTTDEIIEKLYEAGCNDALIGIGKPQMLGFMFSREAESRDEAIASAKNAILKVLPDAVFWH